MEKFDKKIVEELKRNLAEADREMKSSFKVVDSSLSDAKDINEVMVAKRVLLLDILNSLPSSGLCCYFCICNSDSRCKDCSYAKVHGKCGVASTGNKSTWSRMIMKIKELREIISEEYWTGKELKEEVANNAKKK